MKTGVRVFLFILLATGHLSLVTVSPADARIIDRIAARVNGDIILLSEVKRKYSQILTDIKNRGEKAEESDIYKMEKETLNIMIEEKLILQFANDNNIKISNDDIIAAIEDVKKRNTFTNEMLEKALESENITLNDYKERLREQMTVSMVINYEITSKIHIGESEVKKYYDEHSDEFIIPEEVRIRHIMLAYNNDADKNSEEVIKRKIGDILNKIRNGEDFSELALIHSEDPSAKNGGDIGYFTRGKMIKVFEDAAFMLKKGEVSEVIRTPFGFHIIKCDDRKESGLKILKDVSGETEKKIFTEKVKSLKDAWFNKIKEKAFIEVLY